MNIRLRIKPRRETGVLRLDISNIIELILVFVLFERLLIQIGLPGSIIYILDVVNLVLLIKLVNRQTWKRFPGLVLPYILLVFFTAGTAIINYTIWNGNLLSTLIELRNILRFLIFFIACVTYLNEEDCKRIYKILTIFFFVNIPIMFYQYITYHPVGVWTRGDYLNGIFGTTVGGNTFVNVILVVVVTYMLVQWSNGETTTKYFILAVLLSLIISSLIELKAFFLEFAILYVWYLTKKQKSKKEWNINIAVIVMIVIVVYLALQIMYIEYPWFKGSLTLVGMIESVVGNGYSGAGDLNRFTGIFTIASEFFKGNFFDILFGIGAGNASSFTIGGNVTEFYDIYKNSHYNWFSATYTFVQGGVIGLTLYMFTFIYLFVKKKNKQFKINSEIMCIMALFLIFYGEALKTDAGYFVYFAIASGFIYSSKNEHQLVDGNGIKRGINNASFR